MNHTEKAKSTYLQVKTGIEESELGLEIISFDDPVNTVPSANLISGEYLSSSTESSHPSAVVTTNSVFLVTARKHNFFVKVPQNDPTEATTKEPGSIIERIINSITAISSTPSPDVTPKVTTTLETETTRGSAILKLASKKPQRSRKNSTQTKQRTTKAPKRVETSTTEKPTTIIERILSSLSAIQADSQTVSSTQVGTTYFNTITTPLPTSTPTKSVSRVTKSTTPRSTSTSSTITTSLPAQVSTSIDPLNVLEQLSLEQSLQERTIGKLLALLNSFTSTPEPESTKLVVVTPKLTTYLTGTPADNFVDSPIVTYSTTTVKSTTPITTTLPTTTTSTTTTTAKPTTITTTIATTTTTLPPTTSTTTPPPTTTIITTTVTPKVVTTPVPIAAPSTQMVPTLGSRLQETLSSLARFMSSTFNPVTETTTNIPKTIMPTITTPPTTTTVLPTTTSSTTITTTTTPTTTTTVTTTTTPTTTVVPPTTTAILSIETTTTKPSTTTQAVIPSSLSVTTESATNTEKGTEFSSTISTTSSSETTTDPAFTIPSTWPTLANFEVSPGSVRVYSANDLVDAFDPDDSLGTTVSILSRGAFEPPTTPFVSTTAFTSTTTPAAIVGSSMTTEVSTNTTVSTAKVAVETTTQNISSSVITTTGAVTAMPKVPLNQTTVTTPTTNLVSDRSGRLLNINVNPVSNDIQKTSTVAPDKDYYIFAVLNNNTILRKRPSTYPTKETPFLIYGVLPNNTVVQRFPNGTAVPMEPIIRVSGFDTRPNPPPLPEITSNQVTTTPDRGPPDNVNLQTVLIVNNFWWLVLLQLLSHHMSLKNLSIVLNDFSFR